MQGKLKKAFNLQNMVSVGALVVLFVLFAATTHGKFLAWNNIKTLIAQMSATVVAATGCAFVMTHNNLDFSLGGAAGLCAIFAFLITGGGANLVVILIVAMVLGICIGAFQALVHVGGHVPAFMAGMCIMFAGKGVCEAIIGRSTTSMTNVMPLQRWWFYLAIAVGIFILGAIIFNFTKIGKYQKLIGSNEVAAGLSGVHVSKYKVIAFLISGLTVGLTSFILMVRLYGPTLTLGSGMETDVLIALSLGGLSMTGGSSSKIRAVLLGVAIYFILSNGLVIWGVNANMVNIVKAIVFLLTVFMSKDRTQKYAI